MRRARLTLQEIAEIFVAATCSGMTCATKSTRLEAALRRTDEKIATLTAARGKLDEALARCRCSIVSPARMRHAGALKAAADTVNPDLANTRP